MATYDLKYPGAAIDAILDTAYHLQQAGYIFRGSASDYSGTPTEREWVIAPAGFSGLGLSSAVPQGSFGICLYNGTAWVGKVINVLTLDSAPTRNSQNGVTSGGVAATLDEIAGGIMATFASLLFDDETAAADLSTKLSYAVKFSVSDVYQTVTHLNILAATTSKAGLMSSEDKAKVDSFLTNLRSLTFTDTTASADQGTKITETLKATIGGVQEVIDSITLLAATSSKAGLLSASDKAYIDALPAALTNLSNSISAALALMESLVGYYVCDTAAATAAKTVAATGYSLTNGGCIRIKMTNANTAANVTLNINSTGAKALYYDGTQASSTNTWEAGEVLEVYYDGTQYQCASGGGGKFASGEKVKDVSITDTLNESTALIESAPVKAAVDNIHANIGYYTCDTAAATAAKTVTATGYTLTNGGCIRIKMTNANTADNVTLNINSTGAKALYYNGTQASATNTWEAGEVLEVYYDGTQYQCASGGGGKFATGENVKDTSITNTIAEENTALPTSGAVYGKLNETIGLSTHLDLSSLTQQNCSLGTNKWYMGSSGNQRHIAIPVQASEKYLITSNIGGLYAFVTNLYNPPYSSGSSIPFVSSESARYSLNANTQTEITIPSDAAYLILTTVDGNGNTCSWDVISMSPLGNVKFASGQVLGNTKIDEVVSANAVGIPKTAAVYSELTKRGYYNEPMDIAGINDAECSLGDTKWFLASSRVQRHKAIHITGGYVYKIKGVAANGTSSVFWATITSAYNPVSNTNINFTSNESSRNSLNSGQEYTFTAPDDAAYLILTTVDGNGVSSTWEVTFISELAEIIEGLSKDASTNNVRIPYDASNISFANFYIAPSTLLWKSSTTYKGKLIPAEQYRGMRMTATKNGSVLRLAFITAPPVNDAGVNFSIGTTLIDTTNDQVDTYVPQDCNYIYIYTYSKGTDVEPALVFYGILSQIFIDKFQFATIVNTSSLTEQNCSLGTKTWYLNSSGIQRHIAIPVQAGEVYKIIPDTNAFYGYISSSYNPPYSNGNTIPYATGTRIMLYGGERKVVVIPDGCSYLILNIVDGNGLRCNWNVYKGTLAKTLQTPHSIAKFRICSWNIGHFALGAYSDTRINYSNYSEMRNKWAAKINEMNADIICCAEYNTFVVNAEGDNPPILASATIFEPYQYAYVGKKLGYAQQCIFSPSELFDVNEVDFPVVTQSRYYLVGTLLINNIPVKIVSTHLDWNGDDKRQVQMQKLINDFANEEYVIICADFNVATSDEYNVFANAGYEMANHGYMGDLPTHPAGNAPETYLDNIISKGFKINGIHVLNDAELSDHCAIYADLTMII